MSNQYHSTSSPHRYQQAFPPFPRQPPLPPQSTLASPSFPYSRPDPHFVSPSSSYNSSQSYHQAPLQDAQSCRSYSKGTEYLRSLTSSVSNLKVSDSSFVYPEPGSIHGKTQDHGVLLRAPFHSDPSSPNYNKQLPPLPYPSTTGYEQQSAVRAAPALSDRSYCLIPPPLPPRPHSLPASTHDCVQRSDVVANLQNPPYAPYTSSRAIVEKPGSQQISISPPRTFRPSVHPHSKPRLSDEDRLRPPFPHTPPRPHSDPSVATCDSHRVSRPVPKSSPRSPSHVRKTKTGVDHAEWKSVIDLTLSSASESGQDTDSDSGVQPCNSRSQPRRKRATSTRPLSRHTQSNLITSPQVTNATPSKSDPPGSVRCSGYTRSGQPCRRSVKVSAPFLTLRGSHTNDEEDERSERVMGRYCKDHAGMICQVGGFYWRSSPHDAGIWINFDGQQTQTLLRMTMESKLTDKESPGYLYAYELKDLETPTVAYFKVGRTDNVPRRIGQWTNQCQSKTPTLRDIFPLPPLRSGVSASTLQRSGTVTTSFLPGATTHRTPPAAAMKRWERLVHLELSEVCAAHPESQKAYERVREKCKDCGTGHKEIFPLHKAQSNGRVYEEVVVEVICRWERFVKTITGCN